MNSAALTFVWTPWSLGAAFVAFAATAALSFIAWRRSGYRKSILALETLRLAIVALAGVLINQPEWVEVYRPKEKPAIAVLWDDSASMGTRDVLEGEDADRIATTRRAAIAALTSESTWASLAEPLNWIASPTFQVSVDDGVEITGTGGVLPTLITLVVVPVARPGSVTRSLVVTLPGDS